MRRDQSADGAARTTLANRLEHDLTPLAARERSRFGRRRTGQMRRRRGRNGGDLLANAHGNPNNSSFRAQNAPGLDQS